MEHTPLISVIVPIYKVEEYLAECVNSIRNQTYTHLEILLVDDGSPDRCGQMCDAFAEEDPRIRVIHKANGGLSDARNAGIDVARGEYLGFVDSDDRIMPDMYRSMMALAQKMDVAMVCAGRFDMYDDKLVEGLCPEREEAVSGEKLSEMIFTWDHLDSASWDKLYRADLFEGIRYPKGYVAEDVPVTYQVALKAGRVGLIPERFYCYRHRAGSITTSKMSDNRLHVLEHTRILQENINENYPGLIRPAKYYRLCQVLNLLQTIQFSDRTVREKYAQVYTELKRELSHDVGFILKCDIFSIRRKVETLLTLTETYRPLRDIYHKLIGRE